MKYIRIILISWVILLSGCNKEAMDNYSVTNHKIDGPIPYSFTVYKHKSRSDENTVLYYLHGSGGNDQTWGRSLNKLKQRWEKNKKPVPIVIGISLGPRWVLVPKNRSARSGLLEYFLETIIPGVEKTEGCDVKRRYIMGISMGAHNAAQLVFRHPELFQKAALVSPSIYPFSLYSDDETIDLFCRTAREHHSSVRNKIKYRIFKKDTVCDNIKGMVMTQRNHTPDQTSWEKANIIGNMKKPTLTNLPLIYISCGNNDEHGFYYGSRSLAEKARSLSYGVTLSILKGGHESIDEKEIADFFTGD